MSTRVNATPMMPQSRPPTTENADRANIDLWCNASELQTAAKSAAVFPVQFAQVFFAAYLFRFPRVGPVGCLGTELV